MVVLGTRVRWKVLAVAVVGEGGVAVGLRALKWMARHY